MAFMPYPFVLAGFTQKNDSPPDAIRKFNESRIFI